MPNGTSQYITTSTGGTVSNNLVEYVQFAEASWGNEVGVKGTLVVKKGIAPQLYFKYIKKKFGVLETMRLDARLKRLEKAFNAAVANGQEALGEKILKELARETRESAMYVKGIKHFIEYDDVQKHKRNIKGGHISDTKFKDFTRVIPDDVLAKKKAVEDLFDGFVIYHVWDEEAEKKLEKKQKIDPEERSRMRDPVLFGVIKESNRLYFIADWEDEYCDLTFEEIVDVVGKKDEELTIPREPKL